MMRSEKELIEKLMDYHNIMTTRDYIYGENNELYEVKMLLWTLGILESIPQISFRDKKEGQIYGHIFEYNGKPIWDDKDIIRVIEFSYPKRNKL